MFRTLANKITLFRVLLIPAFLVLAYTGHRIGALAVYVTACLSDAADGYVARRFAQTSTVGTFLDPLADKALVLAAMCFFIERGQLPGWVVALVLVREFAVSGLRLVAAERGIVIAASRWGKVKTACTMVCLCAMLLLDKHNIVNIISTALILLTTLVSGVQLFAANAKVFRS